jgi:hypothetical protein
MILIIGGRGFISATTPFDACQAQVRSAQEASGTAATGRTAGGRPKI